MNGEEEGKEGVGRRGLGKVLNRSPHSFLGRKNGEKKKGGGGVTWFPSSAACSCFARRIECAKPALAIERMQKAFGWVQEEEHRQSRFPSKKRDSIGRTELAWEGGRECVGRLKQKKKKTRPKRKRLRGEHKKSNERLGTLRGGG